MPASETPLPPSETPLPPSATPLPPTELPFTVKSVWPPMARVTRDALNLRRGPGTAYEAVGSLPANTRLEVVGESGDWYLIMYGGQEVFIASWLTDEVPTATASPIPVPTSAFAVRRFASPLIRYTHGAVNLREGPGTRYQQVGSVAAGASLQALGQSGDWYLIEHNGRDAYIASWLTYNSPPAAATSRYTMAQFRSHRYQPQQPVQQQPVQQQPVHRNKPLQRNRNSSLSNRCNNNRCNSNLCSSQ